MPAPGLRVHGWLAAIVGAMALAAQGVAERVHAQEVRVGVFHSVLQFNSQNDMAFGGWGAGVGFGPVRDLEIALAATRWPDLLASPVFRAGGSEISAEVRYFPLGESGLAPFLGVGVGKFCPPDNPTNPGGPSNGRSSRIGIGLRLRALHGLEVESGGYYRDDAGSRDLEARLGLGWAFAARGSTPAQGRVVFGPAGFARASGPYHGNGLGIAVEFSRAYPHFTILTSTELYRIRIPATSSAGFLLDSGLILFTAGARHDLLKGHNIVGYVQGGLGAVALLEGKDGGLRPSILIGSGLDWQAGPIVVSPSGRLMTFNSSYGSQATALLLRVGIGFTARPAPNRRRNP